LWRVVPVISNEVSDPADDQFRERVGDLAGLLRTYVDSRPGTPEVTN